MKRIIICTIVAFLITWAFEEWSRRTALGSFSGSYIYAETYILNAPEAEVIQAIETLKTSNPNLQPPNQDSLIYARKPTVYREESITIFDDSTNQAYQEFIKKNPLGTFKWKMEKVAYPDYWLDVDFYYSDTEEIVHTWTRPNSDSTKTTFAFVSIYPLNKPKNVRGINEDFWYVPNKMALHKFQKQIVDRIEEQLRLSKSSKQ